MAVWKHHIVLFGGFYDPGIKSRSICYRRHGEFSSDFPLLANYLNDLWLFDTQEYKWRQIEFKDMERKPS